MDLLHLKNVHFGFVFLAVNKLTDKTQNTYLFNS